MKKPTNFSLLLLLRLSFYVVDRQPTTKEERQILSSSSSLSFFRVQMRGRKEEEVEKTNAKLLFARSRRLLFSKFVRAQKSVRILLRPVLSVVALKDRRLYSSNVMMMRKRSIYTRTSWKNKNIILYTFRTSLGDDLVVVVWINVHGRHDNE